MMDANRGDSVRFRLLTRRSVGLFYATLMLGHATAAEVAGVKVGFVDYSGPAMFSVAATDKHELRIKVDPHSEKKALVLRVELPIAGPKSWPIVDVAVFDSKATAVPVRRNGIEWHTLSVVSPR